MYPPKRGCWYNIKWFMGLLLVGVACIGSMLVGGDIMCRNSVEKWAPYYPNAEEVSVDYNYVRPRAIGTTYVTLLSPDDEETVRQFYRDNMIANLNEEAAQGLAVTSYQIEPNPDGEGTIIRLYSRCVE